MRATGLILVAFALIVTIVAIKSRTQGQKQEGAVQTQLAAEHVQVTTLNVPDMFCAGCEVGVKIAANKVDGVKEVKTNSDKRTAEVSFDSSKTTAQVIASAITKATGFTIEVAAAVQKK